MFVFTKRPKSVIKEHYGSLEEIVPLSGDFRKSTTNRVAIENIVLETLA